MVLLQYLYISYLLYSVSESATFTIIILINEKGNINNMKEFVRTTTDLAKIPQEITHNRRKTGQQSMFISDCCSSQPVASQTLAAQTINNWPAVYLPLRHYDFLEQVVGWFARPVVCQAELSEAVFPNHNLPVGEELRLFISNAAK